MSKKNNFYLLAGLLSLSPIALITTISCTANPSGETNEVLNSVISSFKLVKKADISNILASSITTEEELNKYFLLDGKYQEYNYEFKNANVVNKNDLKVTYIITKKNNSMISGKSEIILSGFKKTEVIEEALANAVSQFNIVLKSNKTVSGVNASSINSESELLKYFNLVGQNGEEGFSYSFKEAKPSGNLSSKLDVTYEISFQGMKQTKHITLEGFNPTSTNNSQEETYNWKEKEDKYTNSLAYYLDATNSSTTDGLDPNKLNASLLSELRQKIYRQTGEDGKDENGQSIYAWDITLTKKQKTAYSESWEGTSRSSNNDAVIFTKTNHTFTKTYGTTKWKFEVYTVTVTENTTVTINFDTNNKKTFKELGYKTDFIIDFAYGKKEESTTQDQQNLSETRQKYQNTKLEVTNKK